MQNARSVEPVVLCQVCLRDARTRVTVTYVTCIYVPPPPPSPPKQLLPPVQQIFPSSLSMSSQLLFQRLLPQPPVPSPPRQLSPIVAPGKDTQHSQPQRLLLPLPAVPSEPFTRRSERLLDLRPGMEPESADLKTFSNRRRRQLPQPPVRQLSQPLPDELTQEQLRKENNSVSVNVGLNES